MKRMLAWVKPIKGRLDSTEVACFCPIEVCWNKLEYVNASPVALTQRCTAKLGDGTITTGDSLPGCRSLDFDDLKQGGGPIGPAQVLNSLAFSPTAFLVQPDRQSELISRANAFYGQMIWLLLLEGALLTAIQLTRSVECSHRMWSTAREIN
eukprot:1138443-Pelagomonas_calceolata.AAC.5